MLNFIQCWVKLLNRYIWSTYVYLKWHAINGASNSCNNYDNNSVQLYIENIFYKFFKKKKEKASLADHSYLTQVPACSWVYSYNQPPIRLCGLMRAQCITGNEELHFIRIWQQNNNAYQSFSNSLQKEKLK